MMVENHAKGKIAWPNNGRVTVAITFDFQGGEPVRPGPNGKMNNEDYAEGEYGPKTGIWRILRMLDEVKVKTTFLTCGGIAERYPDAMTAIVEQGHEIAGHGYHHEIARDLTRQEEKDCIRRTSDMLMKRTGKRPIGWRTCTQSVDTVELLMEEGYVWNSNSFADDLPFVWEKEQRAWLSCRGNLSAMAGFTDIKIERGIIRTMLCVCGSAFSTISTRNRRSRPLSPRFSCTRMYPAGWAGPAR